MEPVVSVIVPAYNTAAFIAEALDSVFAQRFDAPFEVIVVNDGSPDTPELERALEPYRSRLRYLVKQNGGSSSARNAALRLALGRYVAMLDSDDILHPEYLASQVAILDGDPAIDVVYPDAERFGGDESGVRYSSQYPVGGEITFSRVLGRECQVYGEVTARTRALLEIGGYDESLSSAEDFDLWVRLLHAGGRIAYNDRVLAYYRVRSDSHTADGRRLAENVVRVLDKAAQLPGLSGSDMGAIRRQRSGLTAGMKLDDAKAALIRGDSRRATTLLGEVAASRKEPKVLVMLLALRMAPSLAVRLYRALAN